jgi:hypothetical protein
VVEGMNNKETKKQSLPDCLVAWLLGCSKNVWRELIWPCRRTWAGLATVWVALAVFNAVHAERGQTVIAKSSQPAAAMRLAFMEQQRLLTEIIGPAAPALPAEMTRQPNNKPRSERRPFLMMA